MKKTLTYISIFLFFHQLSLAQTYTPGNSYFGENNYIEYIAGNLPIIISAPHGGSLEPTTIPNRNCSGCVYVKDSFTQELIRQIQEAIFELMGCYPHIIINRLHRRKLDANRAIGDAADGNAQAEQAWHDFHDFISNAKDSAAANFGKGLYLDLHGHGHEIQRLELGYLISKSELQLPNTSLNQSDIIDDSSIKNLVYSNLNEINLSDLIRGDDSFGELYENENYPAVPSQTDPFPFNSESYFSGGYNTRRHGSEPGGSIDGIQVECNMEGVRNTFSNREAFAEATAKVIKNYFEKHYFGNEFLNNGCNTLTDLIPEKEKPEIEMNIFPNPVFGYLYLDLNEKTNSPISISVLNNMGQVIYNKNHFENGLIKINCGGFLSGIYFLKIENGEFLEVRKLLK